ncbi:MAG: D-tyrosyl-tRNA(Tyr) deacylase [Candidatus Melainabacteria bacterium RIFCSPLOWO2_02_FULL_35_15]|nr:MAG: D-tyrosyl-tRNA(Tyr) deacylase [Candidatus Melainabacteria bacterium RIFCSPLOWO2_12_FULL_35_11]OGI13715.1 MAG: D-tyrosyl-tRNA(Tyr) deacylase [Candidatus Melainabacteria bacterium RIFCSPLOWO2_02_FULL_35_15]
MITLIQRVKHAKVSVKNQSIGEICNGLLLYIGFEENDSPEKIQWSINKIINLRIFADKEDKMNLSLLDTGGEIMAISNFTLPADLNESGRRPSFTKSAKPDIAEGLYNQFIENCKKQNIKIASGKFGAMMDIESTADGPVNFILKC